MDPSQETLEFWILRFLDAWVVAEAVSASTLKAYRYTLSSLARFLNSHGISQWAEARAPLLEAFLQDATARRGWSPSTWNQKVAALRAFFRFLETEGVIQENPAILLRWHSPRRGIRLPLSVDQRQRLWETAETLPETPLGLRDRLIVALIGHLGLRAGQAVALTVEDVDLTWGRLRIPGRGGPRWLELPEIVARCLQRYLDAGRPVLIRDPVIRALLLNHRGEPLTRHGLWRAIKVLALRAGLSLSISPERLRQPPGLPLSMNDPPM
ncbi:tyrosine-type recombinase/integrase [Thermoflexus sp.]|uniref:tyrosine-type recombinase/integrase n=1 Tax=Thermoflexus sp. TaxID=1969742 RepID=UPI002ADE2289|nr:site-specific integrase [Thermoflexus sp.]